jgi:hypothetical protein
MFVVLVLGTVAAVVSPSTTMAAALCFAVFAYLLLSGTWAFRVPHGDETERRGDADVTRPRASLQAIHALSPARGSRRSPSAVLTMRGSLPARSSTKTAA